MENISVDIEESNAFGMTCSIYENNWINYLGAFFPEEKLFEIKQWFNILFKKFSLHKKVSLFDTFVVNEKVK